MNATFQRHLDAIGRGEVTKTNVIGIRKAINAAERREHGYSVSSTCPRVTAQEVEALQSALRAVAPVVVGELHETGVVLLRNPRFKRDLAAVADLIEDGPIQFRLIGFSDGSPYYLVECRRGSFRFQHFPWQRAYGGGGGKTGAEVWEVKRPG